MADPNNTAAPAGAPASTPSGSAPLGAPSAGAPPAPAPQGGVPDTREMPDGRVQFLSPKAFKRMKDDFREKGRTAAMTELNELAKAAGFDSAKEAFAALKGLGAGRGPGAQPPRRDDHRGTPQRAAQNGAGQPPQPPQRPSNKHDRRAWEKYERARATYERQIAEYRDRLNRSTQRSRVLARQLEAQEAEAQLREIAIGKGVRDVRYALFLLKEHLASKPDEEIAKFDEGAFFDGLRQTAPYLFGEVTAPAHTGTAGGAQPPPPAPGKAAAAAATAAQFDARKATREQLNDRLRGMGISVRV